MKKNLLLLLTCLVSFTIKAQTTVKLNKPLADSLASLAIIDQTAARPQLKTGRFAAMDKQQWRAYQDSVFSTHKKLLENIYAKYGFPGYDLVGKTGSNHYWLMVQHCDKYPDFQTKVLASMKKQLEMNNADPKNYAYLTDRVRLNTGQKQLYGTQVTYNTDVCQAYPKPVADSLRLDERRKQVGLEPLKAYLNQMTQSHFIMNQESYKSQGINQPKLYALEK